jgi:hypothetical protein
MKPMIHCNLSRKKYGGTPSDYNDIHNFMDISKLAHPDIRHRAILHNSIGPYLAERAIGVNHSKAKYLKEKYSWTEDEYREILALAADRTSTSIVNSDGIEVSVRSIAESHIVEDMGRIPTLSDYLNDMPIYSWLGHGEKGIRKIVLKTNDEKNS